MLSVMLNEKLREIKKKFSITFVPFCEKFQVF